MACCGIGREHGKCKGPGASVYLVHVKTSREPVRLQPGGRGGYSVCLGGGVAGAG